jgi:hypothetical protein
MSSNIWCGRPMADAVVSVVIEEKERENPLIEHYEECKYLLDSRAKKLSFMKIPNGTVKTPCSPRKRDDQTSLPIFGVIY